MLRPIESESPAALLSELPQPTPSRTTSQIPALTGLRFFAAFFILFAHSADWLAQFQDSDIRSVFSAAAIYGMPLFFVLSGFVIHYNYSRLFRERGGWRATCEFAAARFARLFPLYMCLLVIAIAADDFIGKTQNQGDLWAKILAYYVTLTHSWWYIVYGSHLISNFIFGLSWSISTEMFFYAAFVTAVFAILAIRTRGWAIVVAFGYALAVIASLLLVRYFVGGILAFADRNIAGYIGMDRFQDSFFRWLFYFSPYVRVLEFFLGCLAAHAFMLHVDRPVGATERRLADVALVVAFGVLCLIGAIYLGLFNYGQLRSYIQFLSLNFACAPAVGFILFYVARYDSTFTRLMSLPALIVLGEMSYSIYLVHTWTLRLFLREPAPPLTWLWGGDAILRIACGICLTIVVSYATYNLIEIPCRIWLRRKLGRLVELGFDRRFRLMPWPAPVVPAGTVRETQVRSGRKRVTFSVSAAGLLVGVATGGQFAHSQYLSDKLHRLWYGDRSEVVVISASYGLNCRDVPSQYPKHTTPGNVTAAVKQACDGQRDCNFYIDTGQLGDPANGCSKDFDVDYICARPGDNIAHLAHMRDLTPGEAGGKVARLNCAK